MYGHLFDYGGFNKEVETLIGLDKHQDDAVKKTTRDG